MWHEKLNKKTTIETRVVVTYKHKSYFLCVYHFYIGSSQEGDDRIKDGDVDIIFASPESLVRGVHWRAQFQKLKVETIVIDEFHTIATW